MKTQVKTLYELAKTKYNMTLHCGQSGINNSASWVYLAEDIKTVSFLKGGELVITTGLFTQAGVNLYDFIRSLATYNCCGILINVGQYLHVEDITPEIITFCNVNNIPLFSMPWEVHLVDIMQDYCSLFLQNNKNEDHLSAAFQSAIYQIPTPENVLRTFNQLGFTTLGNYRIIAIRNIDDITQVTSPLNVYGFKYHIFKDENIYYFIYDAAQKQISLNEIIEIICFCDSIIVGSSDTCPSLGEVSVYFKRARFSLAAAEIWKRQYVSFEALGIFQILFSITDTNLLEQIYKQYLGELENYDLLHDSDYMNTLRTYLLSDCNLLDTAFRLHTHRNTIVYRMNKIKEILNTELDNSSVKFNLLMAFYIREYLSM